MYPTLFTLGSFSLQTRSVVVLLGFFVTVFVLWNKVRDEHYDDRLFLDGFLYSVCAGILTARVGFVLANWTEIGMQPLRWFQWFSYPGFLLLPGLLGAGVAFYRFASQQKWDEFEVLDYWSIAITTGLGVLELGNFFAGFGFVDAIPLPIFLSLALFFISFALAQLEYRYRTFEWYKPRQQSAQTGFLIAVALMAVGSLYAVASLFRTAQMQLFGVSFDAGLYGMLVLFGAGILFSRARVIARIRKHKQTNV